MHDGLLLSVLWHSFRVHEQMGGVSHRPTSSSSHPQPTQPPHLSIITSRVIDFLLADGPARPRLCLGWAALLLLFTRLVIPISQALQLRRIVVRKLFHLLAVAMFVPATYAQVCVSVSVEGRGERKAILLAFSSERILADNYLPSHSLSVRMHTYTRPHKRKQPQLLSLAYAVALAALLLLEYARMSRHAPLPLGKAVHRFYAHFLDERDLGHMVVTHFYLLLGCAFPLWLSWLVPPKSSPILPYAGVLVLGIGDSTVRYVLCACRQICLCFVSVYIRQNP